MEIVLESGRLMPFPMGSNLEFMVPTKVSFFTWEANWGTTNFRTTFRGEDDCWQIDAFCVNLRKYLLITSSFTITIQGFYGNYYFLCLVYLR